MPTIKKPNDLALGVSQPALVNHYIKNLKHPLINLVKKLRTIILSTNKNIGEGIFWNAPTFYFIGKMTPFDPKKYKRYIVGFNFYKQDELRLIFLRGALANDKSGLLTGDYKDGRRVASFKTKNEVNQRMADLKKILKVLVKKIDD